ncbi:MAG: hypothetical protein NC908_02075, partial [Candidatus Omnitrophica bacterium]|nr:hypothetical protein [Candidatus Omnitrophota bacterium]
MEMKIKMGLTAILILVILSFLLVYAQEELTITTYYPSPYGSYQELSLGGGADWWTGDSIPGFDRGFASSDGALFIPVHRTGTELSDLRLYIVDNIDDSFSIWGNTCVGDCRELSSAINIATFMGGGNVGIGTTDPRYPLQVGSYAYLSNDNTNEFAIFGAKTAGGGGNRIQVYSTDFRVGTSLTSPSMRIDGSGNVGIGTTGPGARLELNT